MKETCTIEDVSKAGDGRPPHHFRAKVTYAADGHSRLADVHMEHWRASYEKPTKRPSIHMPRWASRLLLEITEVRVERLQSIAEEDAKAEGLEPKPGTYTADFVLHGYVDAFAELWGKLNGPRGFGWDANPWVWAISFKPVEASN